MDNFFYRKTFLPAPKLEWNKIWRHKPMEKVDILPPWVLYENNNEIWPDDINNKLKKAGLKIYAHRIFRWNPNNIFAWHIDPTESAVNWVYEGKGKIQWNKNLDLTETGLKYNDEFKMTPTAQKFKFGTLDDEYDCETFGDSCLLRVNIPHRIININNIHRITSSILFQQYSYEDIDERLRKYNL